MLQNAITIRYNEAKMRLEAFLPDGTLLPYQQGITLVSEVGEVITARIDVVVNVDFKNNPICTEKK